MDVNNLLRDPNRVKSCLQELPDQSLVTTKGCKIIIPSRFEERGLAQIGIDTYIVGIYAIIVEDKYYAVSLVNTMLRITPSSTMKIKIKGVEHYEFTFDPGQIVLPRTNVVKDDILVYKIYDEILSKGKVPWYLGYDELGHIFDTALSHAGANVGTSPEVTELIVSIIARNKDDRTKYYRSTIESIGELKTNPPVYISMKSVPYAATNTTNKLAGSYWSEGVVSALISPTDRQERIENILLQ